jgi:hypothetical protein
MLKLVYLVVVTRVLVLTYSSSTRLSGPPGAYNCINDHPAGLVVLTGCAIQSEAPFSIERTTVLNSEVISTAIRKSLALRAGGDHDNEELSSFRGIVRFLYKKIQQIFSPGKSSDRSVVYSFSLFAFHESMGNDV